MFIRGEQHYRWRAVDANAAERFFPKLLSGLQYIPRVIVADKLKSYAAAKREILRGVVWRGATVAAA